MAKRVIILLLVLAVPFLLVARGNQEAGKGQGITLAENFSDLLTRLDAGEITEQEAREELGMMQNRFELRNEERKALEDLAGAVGRGDMTADQAYDGIPDQLRDRTRLLDRDPDQDRTRDKLMDQDKDQDQDQDQDCDPDQDQTQDKTQDQLHTGSSGGGNGKS